MVLQIDKKKFMRSGQLTSIEDLYLIYTLRG
jgi:hypothetical protein